MNDKKTGTCQTLLVAAAAALLAASAGAKIAAVTPTGYAPGGWQMKTRLPEIRQNIAQGGDVVFIGDSINNGWIQQGRGPAQWKKYFCGEPYRGICLGVSSDRTEHVLWRLTEDGELDGYEAKCVFLMIGTNNAGHKKFADEPPADTILAIREILKVIRQKQPGAVVVLTAIFPRGKDANDAVRLRNEVVNREIFRLADGETVFWMNFNDQLVDAKGDTQFVMRDRLHPGGVGYEAWYAAAKPFIDWARSDRKGPRPKQGPRPAALAADEPEAVRPVSRISPRQPWWADRLERNRNQISEAKGEIDLVFFGDSITHNWEGKDQGAALLAELRKTYSVLNIGYGGDRTQHLVWRGENGELDGYRAKCVMLMIGTNNPDSAEDVATGVRRILDIIARKQPQAKTLLLPIFPRGAPGDPRRAKNERANALIKGFADGEKVVWVDFNAKFLDTRGDVKWCMPDRVHPNAEAYRDFWLPAVLPHFKAICGK